MSAIPKIRIEWQEYDLSGVLMWFAKDFTNPPGG